MPTTRLERFRLVESHDSALMRLLKLKYEEMMGLPQLYAQIENHQDLFLQHNIWSALLNLKKIDLTIHGQEHLVHLKSEEGVVVISNHPRGLLDGICLGMLTTNLLSRPHFKFIASSVIGRVFPEIHTQLISVEKISWLNKNQKYLNGLALSEALQVLKSNGTLVFHPAGLVSEFRLHSPEGFFRVTDLDWDRNLFRLAQKTECAIVPVHISGRNSNGFQCASFAGDIAKKSLLFREFMKAEGESITLTIRPPIRLEKTWSLDSAVNSLRASLYNSR